MRAGPGRWAWVVAALVGGVAGLGFFAFDYGEGLSYFSPDPRACANCHVMHEHYASWQKGGHHQAAACVDCHLPHDFVGKYLAKAENGFWHSKGFVFMDFHEPIRIKESNSEILQASCLRCHGEFVHELVSGSRSVNEDAVLCVHCHRGVGHGARY
ncbi:cytochrome c nitrite reductase small subunit [Polyangium spumosum]|uniref:Cytochrome c nitrite reductase small subunit n=1 Tax=Polyangium spumosum TaxID=889282 RepID=A0A6N7PKM4_9BACT|nr:cytochrome c nitrite reductase small subunit [Polyangium spumosum]MRG92337.1 cytochrome c nitrite reductase small subunit [Polyangium spumosum]